MLLAILLPTSCSFEEDMLDIPTSDAEKVQLNLNVSLAGTSNADSRAFGNEDHNFTVLYLALFEQISDGNYYLKDFITANKVNGAFAVNLPKTANPCRLHFIANYPGLSMGFNEEGQLMGLLETLNQEGGHDVFWNYVSLDGIGVNNQTSLSLSVSLLRNYVQIRFDKGNSNFTDLDEKTNDTGLANVQYAIFNVPTKGTVAAYNPLLENKFANFVNGNTLRSYDDLTSDGYEGNEPYDDGTFLGNNDADAVEDTESYWNDLDDSFYMYERSNRKAEDNKTCMIIRGKYNGATNYTYYKLDFVYNDAATQSKVYYNLLRNFIYTMRVTSVTGEGYSSVAEAISQPACNNISGDAVVADYTNISNGTSQLFVSSTYLLFTNTNSVDLYFKYMGKSPVTTDYDFGVSFPIDASFATQIDVSEVEKLYVSVFGSKDYKHEKLEFKCPSFIYDEKNAKYYGISGCGGAQFSYISKYVNRITVEGDKLFAYVSVGSSIWIISIASGFLE